ncbi:unnamed protein product [Microthlaspi erraticum]|uniref:Bystin n=1 Tax=Microthlaspi erraticum TaxID=1685480 RepID=A0A6D2K5X1_9BRAS|nr:unnamed protein product [Microthlaspi erraticum]
MAKKRSFRAVSVAATSPTKGCKARKLTEKILKAAYEQQKEVEDEENAEKIPMITSFKQAVYGFENFTDDDDYDQSQEFESQLDDDYQPLENEEDKLLVDAFFQKDGASLAKRLSNAITSSIKDLEDKDDVSTGSACISEADYYQKLGKFMSMYTHGKMPKALNHVTKLDNWADLLKLTQPENWSPTAMYKATIMFASSTKAGRFFELFLLPRSGTCTNAEARIIGSIIQKFSIPEVFSSAALVCLAEMKFLRPTSYFIKVILEKKYALALSAIDAVAAHFLRFHKETKVMDVIWHQTLLAFVQRYKHELRKEDKKSLTSLLDKQNHDLITPEIVRELENSRNRGEKEDGNSRSASTVNNKPIKEDWFDMPQVPMEED